MRILSQTLTVLLVATMVSVCVRAIPCDSPGTTRDKCHHFYGFPRVQGQYSDILATCRKYGGKLAMLETEEKSSAFDTLFSSKTIMKEGSLVFLGAKVWDNWRTFRWEEGPALTHTFSPWQTDEPSTQPGKDCVLTRRPRKWLAATCSVHPAMKLLAACQFCMTHAECSELCLCPDLGTANCTTALGCPARCLRVKKVDSCDYSPCPDKRWGPMCELQCNCAGPPCPIDTGICPGGCDPGWRGASCNQTACPLGMYGAHCDKPCFCRAGQQCNASNGDCLLGCFPGAGGNDCTLSPCDPGRYGPTCESYCNCYNSTTACAQVGGECLSREGCADGWVGPSCRLTRCNTGRFGPGCESYCVCHLGEQCDVNTGVCPGGKCRGGWERESCNVSNCHVGTFGKYCRKTCGCDDLPCDRTTGKCISTFEKEKPDCGDGTWGWNCTRPCHKSVGKHCATCDRQTGKVCTQCTPGYSPDLKCNQVCHAGSYGVNCSESCILLCPSGKGCDAFTGKCQFACPNECKIGQYCARSSECAPCPPGTFGEGCTQSCQCPYDSPCDPLTGECQDEDSAINDSLVMITLIVCVCIFFTLLLVILCWFWGKQSRDSKPTASQGESGIGGQEEEELGEEEGEDEDERGGATNRPEDMDYGLLREENDVTEDHEAHGGRRSLAVKADGLQKLLRGTDSTLSSSSRDTDYDESALTLMMGGSNPSGPGSPSSKRTLAGDGGEDERGQDKGEGIDYTQGVWHTHSREYYDPYK